jgi:translocation and assembly module TamA
MGDPRKEWMSVSTGAQHENTDTSAHDTFKLGVQRTRNRWTSWLETRYLDYQWEDFTVAEQAEISQLVIFGTNWETARGRELRRIASGRRLSLDVRGASDSLGSDTSFLQIRSSAKWVSSLGARSRALMRVKFGVTTKDELSELPASVRFFAGGDNSVRGYDFETLGPVDENGVVVGGTHLLEGSVEIDRLLRDNWALAAFVDSGSAFNTSGAEFSTGVGIGIRWYSPVGPIRFDIAHPLDDPDQSFRIHISLGPEL